MSSSFVPSTYSPEFHDPPPFAVSECVREYTDYLDSRQFETMCRSGVALTILDRNKIARVTFVGA